MTTHPSIANGARALNTHFMAEPIKEVTRGLALVGGVLLQAVALAIKQLVKPEVTMSGKEVV